HVSGVPNHQTLRVTPLNTRFAVAFAGLLGYELNLSDMKKEDLDEIKAQVALYKQWRSVITTGTYYRLKDGNTAEWMVVSDDQKKAVGFSVCKYHEASHSYDLFKTKGLNEESTYHFYNLPSKINIMKFGDLINTLAPIHVKQDALLHQAISKFIKMDGEVEEHVVNGGLLNRAGIKLSQAYNGTGYNTGTRLFSDYEARIYFMEQVEENN
ncbi:MAG: alpha-galactosidase, partial [Erysipelotrichaceae bacterium]|nr:alpha-galactosidase [Erysipelotrichaceae bacterium]